MTPKRTASSAASTKISGGSNGKIWNRSTTAAQAVATSNYIASAVRSYDQAARSKFDYYNGINVVSLVKLLEHLKNATGDQPVDCKVDDVDDWPPSCASPPRTRSTARGSRRGQDGVWAAATFGELELVAGNANKARAHYRAAANAPETTYFNVNSMLDQIYLFENLGFQPEAVAAVKKVLEQRRSMLEKRIGGLKKSEPRFAKVVIASGHMIDTPDRQDERFPPRKEGIVRERSPRSWTNGMSARATSPSAAARAARTSCSPSWAPRGAPRSGCCSRFPKTSSWRNPCACRTAIGSNAIFALRSRPSGEDVFAAGSAQSAAERRVGLCTQQSVDG